MHDPELGATWANLKHVHELVGAALAERVESECGIGASEAYVLFRLANEPDGCLRMGELASRLDMAQSGVTRVIDRLESRGLVIRESRRDDRRTTFAKLTADGRAMFERLRPIFFDTIHSRFAAALSESELRDLRGLLRKIVEASGRCEEEPWKCGEASTATD